MAIPLIQTLLRVINVYHLPLKGKKITVISQYGQKKLGQRIFEAFNSYGNVTEDLRDRSINENSKIMDFKPSTVDFIDGQLAGGVPGGYDYVFIIHGDTINFVSSPFYNIRNLLDESKFNDLKGKKLIIVGNTRQDLNNTLERIGMSDILFSSQEVLDHRTDTRAVVNKGKPNQEIINTNTLPYLVMSAADK